MSARVQALAERVRNLHQADHTLVVFAPQPSEQGFFYDFLSGQVYQLDLGKTIFSDLGEAPFSLPTARDDHSFGGLDTFESVTGQ